MADRLAILTRSVTAPFLFRKSLPDDFGGHTVLVSSRADLRVLAPGLDRAARDLFLVVRKYVSPGDVVWDIGSNLGLLAFSAAVKAGPSGKIYSLEADPRYADIQTRTAARFTDQSARVTILCAAVADRCGVLELSVPRKGHARNHLSIVAGNSPGETEMTKNVVSLTLDWLLDYWEPPQFVKIDVEGAELLAAKGGEKLFSTTQPVIYLECSPDNSQALTAFFRRLGYRFFRLDSRGNETEVDRLQFNSVLKPAAIAAAPAA